MAEAESPPPPPEPPAPHPLVRIATELGPLLVFFFVNTRAGIFAGTAAFMAAILVSFALALWIERRVPVMPLVTAVVVLVFGTLTLVLHDDLFIKLKPTIVNLLFAGILAFGLATRRNFLQIVLGQVLSLDERGWRILTMRWAAFFIVLAVLNEFVWRTFSTDTWVSFKVFGIMPLTVLFSLAQVPLLARHQVEAAPQ